MSTDRIGGKQRPSGQTALTASNCRGQLYWYIGRYCIHSRAPLPASIFPTLAAHGTYAWADDREQRFTSGLDTLICGLQTTQRSPGASRES